jgi:hypothetical protein
MRRRHFFQLTALSLLLLAGTAVQAQLRRIQGRVYDISERAPLPLVSVLSGSGKGALTDSSGFYSIEVGEKDSIWFSYLGKSTPPYLVSKIIHPASFDISIRLKIVELPTVTVRKRDYREDSLQNRKDYAKVFNFKKPGISSSGYNTYYGGATAGLDLEEFINIFRFRRNKNMRKLQKFMIEKEQQKYVDYRFSKSLVRRLTGLSSPELELFMETFRPTYEEVQLWGDVDLGMYILSCLKAYKASKPAVSNTPAVTDSLPRQ